MALTLFGCTDGVVADSEGVASTSQAIWRGANDIDDPVHNAVGYVSDANSLECTGTLLTYGLVLTAKHCVGSVPKGGFNPSELKSEPNRLFVEYATTPTENLGQDLALALLDEPDADELDEAHPQKPTFRKPRFVPDVTVVSYAGYGYVRPGDGYGPSRNMALYRQIQAGVAMKDFCFMTATIETHFASSYFGIDHGDSGGPLFAGLHAPADDLQDAIDIGMRSDQVGVAARALAEDGGSDNISIWTNLLNPANTAWIVDNAVDPNRPERWKGERDYVGPCRSDVDANCDRYFDVSSNGSPVVLDGGTGTLYSRDFMREGIAVYATHTLELNDRVKVLVGNTAVLADVANAKRGGVVRFSSTNAAFYQAAGSITIGEDVSVGDVLSRGPVWARGRATIDSIQTPDTVTAPSATVGKISGATVWIPPIRLSTDFGGTSLGSVAAEPDAAPQLTSPAGQVQAISGCLAPGRYTKLLLNSRTSLSLCGGTYLFDYFQLEPQSTLTPPAGTTTAIFVRKGLIYRGFLNADPSRLLVGYFGTSSVSLDGEFRGTFVAPAAFVELSSRVHWGSFLAKSIRAHQAGTIRFIPLVRPTP